MREIPDELFSTSSVVATLEGHATRCVVWSMLSQSQRDAIVKDVLRATVELMRKNDGGPPPIVYR